MVLLKPTDCGRDSDMCQSSSEFAGKRGSDPEDEFKWEEFFGTSVDLTSTLLDIYDTMVAKNSANSPLLSPTSDRQQTPPPPAHLPLTVKLEGGSAPPCDHGGSHVANSHHQSKKPIGCSEQKPARLYNSKQSYSESVFEEKKRPLSTSSVSSSSSSSSSSLPRNGLDVKKSYLASIESLDDDDDDCQYDGGNGPSTSVSSVADHSHKNIIQGPSSSTSSTTCKPRWCDPNLSHTERVLLEIVDTEKTYVRDLEEIIQGYLEYIKCLDHPNISKECLEQLFSNIEDIQRFNSTFVKELEHCEVDPVATAKCFVNNSSGFEVYTQYCTNYPRTVSMLTELMGKAETAEIFKERQVALGHSLPLGSYLLKPVQRILKYHLLLQNLVKHTEKDSNTCTDIRNALCVMTGIAYHINDMKRKHEHAVRVQEIQSLLYGWQGQDLTTYGELVAEGAFRMYRAKALRHLFLFDKMLLIAKKKEEGILSYKTHIMCSDNLMLIESIPGEPLCFHVIPYKNPRDQHTFQARNLEQKREWCLQLKRVMLENYNAVIPSHARQLVMQLGQSKLEDSATDKTTSKRQLSAPEYLEKRKQERRKSEINLKRGLKLKNNAKKNSASNRRKSSLSGSPMETSYEGENWTKSQDDVNHSGSDKNYYSCPPKGSGSSYSLFSRETRFRHSLPEPSISQHSNSKERGFRQSWRAWNSVPEETTDTENEELNESIGMQRNYRPAARSFESESFEEPYDSSGEYVTFFYAHSYATRDWPENASAYQSSVQSERNLNVEPSSPGQDISNLRIEKKNASANCHNTAKEFTARDPDSESGSSGHSWKHSAALRRVQSFTGMAKAKMSSLHHNISFKHHSKSSNEQRTRTNNKYSGSGLPMHGESNPTSPTKWLDLHGESCLPTSQKSGSLPRSFQLASDLNISASDSNIAMQSDDCSQHRLSLQSEVEQYRYGDHSRPHTIASDNPLASDFTSGSGNFVFQFSPNPDDDYCMLVRRDYQDHETTGCTNTPAISMENVHSIHPELKIYHQSSSKQSALKQVFTSVGSKLANLRAVLSHPASHEHHMEPSTNPRANDLTRNGMGRSSSRSSIRSEGELGHKILSAKLAHSVAKAYSAVLKHKSRKSTLKISADSKSKKGKIVETYKSESSLIGARMAHPLESEYSVPKQIIPPHELQKWKDDLRPDSMFSECSNATSSDGDKLNDLDNCDKDEDSASEASESSADSYYERTFDAIENALTEDMFRDSAIYSDPEDADFSAVETPALEVNIGQDDKAVESVHVFRNGYNVTARLDLICKRPVNQAILERLRVLEENVKSQQEEAAAYRKPSPQKKLDMDKWCPNESKEVEESETSSEHSASTVNTVMESGACLGIENLSHQQSPPRIKGWVKHVVEKLQGDSRA